MTVTIDITNKIYDFIDPATGTKLSPEEFAKKYPGVAVGGYNPSTRPAESQGEATPTKEE